MNTEQAKIDAKLDAILLELLEIRLDIHNNKNMLSILIDNDEVEEKLKEMKTKLRTVLINDLNSKLSTIRKV